MTDTPLPTRTHDLRRLLGYAAPHRGRLALAFALTLLGAAVDLARPWPMKLVVDHVLGSRPLSPAAAAVAQHLPFAATPRGLLSWAVVGSVAVVVGAAAATYALTQVAFGVGQRMVIQLVHETFARLQRLSLSFHGRHLVGDLLQRLSGDVFVLQSAVLGIALPVAVSVLTLGGMLAILVRIDAALAAVAFVSVPFLGAAAAHFARPLHDVTVRQTQRQGLVTAFAEQSLSAVRAIQAFAREPYVQRKLNERVGELRDAYVDSTRVGSRYAVASALVTGTAAAAVLGLGARRVLDGRLTLGELLVFLGYLGGLFAPVTTLAGVVGTAATAAARARRVFEVLDSTDEVPERPGAVTLGRARGEVEFEDVTFGYGAPDGADRAPLLHGISFRAEPGQTVAIVGATGAGKTSLVSLVPRLYDAWEGRVRVDGHDVRDLSLRSLRENVAVVLQEPFLFPMSVADNIAFGRPGATRDEVVAAAAAAQADEFVRRLPQGYDTLVGERGAKLSGGERQRIAIARALLKDAPILILDEPTASLDARTEASLFDALSRLMRGRTTFIVSHRLTTIRRADQIIALEHGRVAERGTHDRLIARGEVYARLYQHQAAAAL